MSNIIIRSAKITDLPVLLRFEQGVINAERPMDVTLKRTDTTYYDIRELIQADHIELAVAEINGEVVGSGYVRIQKAKACFQHPAYGYMGFMYVLPDHRGKGINKLIVNHLFTWCRNKGIYEIRLEVYTNNNQAIKAYQKSGFSDHLLEMRLDLRD